MSGHPHSVYHTVTRCFPDGKSDFKKRIHMSMKHIELYENFGIEVEPYEVPSQIECNKCGWNWNSTDSEPADMYICYKCGVDNKVYYEGEPDDPDGSPPNSGKSHLYRPEE